MNTFQRYLWRFLRPTEPVPLPSRKRPDGQGPQINPGVSPGTVFKSDPTGPQINPGPSPEPSKKGDGSGPQINPGPPADWTPRVQTLGQGRRVVPVLSSRPFGSAQDDVIF